MKQRDRVDLGLGGVCPRRRRQSGAERGDERGPRAASTTLARGLGAPCQDPCGNARRRCGAHGGQQIHRERNAHDVAKRQRPDPAQRNEQRRAWWMWNAQHVRRGDKLAGIPEGDAGCERGRIDDQQRDAGEPRRASRGQGTAPTGLRSFKRALRNRSLRPRPAPGASLPRRAP